jgi:phage terminase large subunit-like protein
MVIPETGEPLILHPEQAAVLRAMSHQTNGAFDYSTWLYSAPKKSGKTTVGAGVALWQACRIPDGQIYIIGNDQKQADNRMMQAIRYAIDHNPRLQKHVRKVQFTIYLDNGTKIESIPVDPRGEAGMNPTGLFWTEAWGAIGNRAELLWSEATLSPTRTGQAFKFIESYAGYKNESLILERLHQSIILNGKPHDSIPELYANGQSVGYWCTRRYMPWQVEHPEYYVQEERENTPSEFARMHGNVWVDSVSGFVPSEWVAACKSEYTLEKNEPVIIGVDAATTSDCFAVTMVSRRDKDVYVHYSRIWTPPKGGTIDFREPEAEIRRLIHEYNCLEISFDAYQIFDMMQRIRDEEVVNARAFSQAGDRLLSDKRLYSLIRDKQLHHHGDTDLVRHITNAAAETDKAEGKLRIVKRSPEAKIDACVALAMSAHRCFAYAF